MLQIVPLPAEYKKFCKLITFNKKFTRWSNRFKTTLYKQLLKLWELIYFANTVEFGGPLFKSHWCMNKHEHVNSSA